MVRVTGHRGTLTRSNIPEKEESAVAVVRILAPLPEVAVHTSSSAVVSLYSPQLCSVKESIQKQQQQQLDCLAQQQSASESPPTATAIATCAAATAAAPVVVPVVVPVAVPVVVPVVVPVAVPGGARSKKTHPWSQSTATFVIGQVPQRSARRNRHTSHTGPAAPPPDIVITAPITSIVGGVEKKHEK